MLRPGGVLLYSTCGLDPGGNGAMARWAAENLGLKPMHERLTLPKGAGESHHDGGYFAALRASG